MLELDDQVLAKEIRASETSRSPVEGSLTTDQRVLARITEGIYRQPASALRELVSNSYDADATEVIILTDAPRFEQISVRDNGKGLSPEILTQLVRHIGGSAKRRERGQELSITSKENPSLSPGGRQLIGKLGIGLFSVAQFTRHFLIITKVQGEGYRTVADITLGTKVGNADEATQSFETGHFRIWREPTGDVASHGTEIKLLDLLPRTKAELASADLWHRQDLQSTDPEIEKVTPPVIHIGRSEVASDNLSVQPSVPWDESDPPRERFEKLIKKLRSLSGTMEVIDLRKACDNYFWTLWTLALSAPVEYAEGHPFDLKKSNNIRLFKLENKLKGQASPIEDENEETLRELLSLKAPDGATAGKFELFIDGVQILRPILLKDLPPPKSGWTIPLLFVGKHREEFGGKPVELSGGPLEFEAYLFWAPRIVPKQHQGVVLRVGNASGSLFDPDFMGYQTSELTRKSQVTAEIFVSTGLDDAINIDRESFNFAHPHYQFITKWLHSAFRQFSNRQKELGKQLRAKLLDRKAEHTEEKIAGQVKQALLRRGIDDVPAVLMLDTEAPQEHRNAEGAIILHSSYVMPSSSSRTADLLNPKMRLARKKAIAIAQLLHGMGLLDSLEYAEQEKLIKDIMEIVLSDEE